MPAAKLTGVEVAIGAELLDITVLLVLIAGSVGLTAWARGRSTSRGARIVQQRR